MSELIKINEEYAAWIKEISQRFGCSQLKAAVKVNDEMLRFYWGLGYDISHREMENKYGKSFFENLSADLKDVLPDVKSFSVTNLRYMKWFYELYPDAYINPPQAGVDLEYGKNLPQAGVDLEYGKNLPQVGVNLNQAIFCIPWGHNKLIIDKCKTDKEKALFFVRKTLENNWSRAVLMNFLDTNLFERDGKAISNFELALPEPQSDLAQAMTKDPYNFDFLTLRENYDEKELKDALMNNVQKFLLELGMGFAFVGREYRLVVGETEQFIDMLFYNINNHCYVVVEVKTRDFEPGDMGQLGTYISATDGILKKDGDNQTVGLLICKGKDNILAQYAVNSMKTPIGISEYELSNIIPENFKSSMPTIEEIEQQLND